MGYLERLVPCVVLALASACAVPQPYGHGVTLHTIASGGYSLVNDETFDGHEVYGLELATCERESGWGYELGFSYGAEEVSGPREHSAEFNELYLGLRRSWQAEGNAARPYLGFGGAFTRVEHDLHSPRLEFEDEGGAAYAHGGMMWLVGPLPFEHGTEFLVGFDLRGEVGNDYDYAQLALVLGFGR